MLTLSTQPARLARQARLHLSDPNCDATKSEAAHCLHFYCVGSCNLLTAGRIRRLSAWAREHHRPLPDRLTSPRSQPSRGQTTDPPIRYRLPARLGRAGGRVGREPNRWARAAEYVYGN